MTKKRLHEIFALFPEINHEAARMFHAFRHECTNHEQTQEQYDAGSEMIEEIERHDYNITLGELEQALP